VLAKKYKLHLKKDLDLVYKKGRRLGTSSLSISFVITKDEISKFAVFVPKKIFKKAHDRNKAKRRIFELIRTNYDNFPNNLAIIFFAKKEVIDKDFDLLQKEIEEIISNLPQNIA
jgi:ribonuclease P protein component